MIDANQVFISGKLGYDPRKFKSDKVTAFTLSVQGAKGNNLIRVVAFDELAKIGQGLKQGDPVFVSGALRTSSWQDKDGNRKSATEVVAKMIAPYT